MDLIEAMEPPAPVNDPFKHLTVVTSELPTYLSAFMKSASKITLVYCKLSGSNHQQQQTKPYFDDTKPVDDVSVVNASVFELTGNPLQVDLCGDDTFHDKVVSEIRPPSWTAAEARHGPTTFQEARSYIGRHVKLSTSPVYVVCNGSDKYNTIILGAHKGSSALVRVVIRALGYHAKTDHLMETGVMELEHLKDAGRSAKVHSYLFTKLFVLFGCKIKNHTASSLNRVENNGSILVEAVSRSLDFAQPKYKMFLQLIVGHQFSPLRLFWMELERIQSFIDILQDPLKRSDGNTVISDDSFTSLLIANNICDLLRKVTFMKKDNQNFDLKNLRPETSLDKLWMIMRGCRDLSDLRDAFQMLFEQLAEGESKLQFRDDDTFLLISIITGILKGKIAVPTVSFMQSLELLLELGLEKLKNDYFAIIKHFYMIGRDNLMKKWIELCETIKNPDQPDNRKSRLTSINSKCLIGSLKNYESKLSYLNQMHVMAEFMFLVKENYHFSKEQLLHSICEHVYNFVNTKVFVTKIQPLVLYECDIQLDSIMSDQDMFDESKVDSLESWSLEMTSVWNSSDVITMFYGSQYAVFPPTIYNAYDHHNLSTDDVKEQKLLYLYKLSKYVEHI